MAVKEVGKR